MKMPIMSRTIVAMCGVALCVVALVGCGTKPTPESVLPTVVERLNMQTPVEVDEITILDSASYVLPSTLRYHYTLALDSLTEAERVDMEAYMRQALQQRVSEESGLEPLRKLHIEFEYHYGNLRGEPLFSVEIVPEEYAPSEE